MKFIKKRRKTAPAWAKGMQLLKSIFSKMDNLTFALSRILPLSLILMVFVSFGMMVQMASSNTIIQTIVEEDKRGRVMSFYTMAFMGMAPFGSLLAGSLASKIGAPN